MPVSLQRIAEQDTSHQCDAKRLCNELAKGDPWQRLGVTGDRLTNSVLQSCDDCEAYFVRSGEDSVGVVKLRAPWLYGLYIEVFGLLAANRGAGVGARALVEIETLARDHNRKNVWLCVSGFNTRAQQFYRQNGFLEIGELSGLIVPHEDEILMRKRIDSGSDQD